MPPLYQTYRKNVKLGGGRTLGFAPGKGYYAKPPSLPVYSTPRGNVAPVVKPPPPAANTNPGPNYGADLAGSPDFTEANAAYQENLSLAHLNRQNRIRAAMIKLGFQPGGAAEVALQGIDPETANLAANNSMSALAQLGLQRGRGRADLANELANRGLLNSGALRGGENMVQDVYNQGLVNAIEAYTNEENAALQDEANAIATSQQTFSAAKAAAAIAAAQNPLFTPTTLSEPPGATLAPGQAPRPDQTPVLATPPPARFWTRPQQVPLKPGQSLRFRAGRGYYAA